MENHLPEVFVVGGGLLRLALAFFILKINFANLKIAGDILSVENLAVRVNRYKKLGILSACQVTICLFELVIGLLFDIKQLTAVFLIIETAVWLCEMVFVCLQYHDYKHMLLVRKAVASSIDSLNEP